MTEQGCTPFSHRSPPLTGAVLASTSPLSLSCPQSLALAAADEEGGAPRVYVADTQNDRVRVFDGEKAERRHAAIPVATPQSFAQVTCARTASGASRVESRDRGRTCLLARTDGELSRRE